MDDDLRPLFQRAVATLNAPTERLVSGAITRGRRRRTLRRVAAAGSTLVVLGGAAAIAVALLPVSAPRTTQAAGPTPTTTPAAKPTSVPMSPQALLQTALESLPRAGQTSRYGGNFSPGYVGSWFVYDDGHGAALIYVDLATDGSFGAPCAPHSAGCTVYADGVRTRFSSAKEFSDGRTPNATNWDVVLFRPDGLAVDITEFNAPQEKDAAITRAEPPFTAAELSDWARNPNFRMQVDPSLVNRSADLFKPVDLDAPATDTLLSPTRSASIEQRNCALAKKIHKTPPSYCAAVG